MSSTTSAAMRDGIFISYRRDDARGASGRLYDWLRIGFGRDEVFRDAISHAKVGTVQTLPANERAQHLSEGLRILEALARDGRLMPSQDHRHWFRHRLSEIS